VANDQQRTPPAEPGDEAGNMDTAEPTTPDPASLDEFRLWPPSPKTQIILIAVAFGVFNAILLAIFVYVMIKRF